MAIKLWNKLSRIPDHATQSPQYDCAGTSPSLACCNEELLTPQTGPAGNGPQHIQENRRRAAHPTSLERDVAEIHLTT